jgi:hypothetical protein
MQFSGVVLCRSSYKILPTVLSNVSFPSPGITSARALPVFFMKLMVLVQLRCLLSYTSFARLCARDEKQR